MKYTQEYLFHSKYKSVHQNKHLDFLLFFDSVKILGLKFFGKALMTQSRNQRFLFKDLAIRGHYVHLNDAWKEMTADRHYGEIEKSLLGELAVVSVMIASNLKHKGKITLQVQGSGPVNLLVIEVTDDLKIRGLIKNKEALTSAESLDHILGDGQIMVTLENAQTKTHFQSFVPREANTIAECFEAFFQQSEQQETKLWLVADQNTAGGLLLQKIPHHGGHEVDFDADGWNRVTHLAATIKDDELLTLDCETIIHRLFHEELVELFDASDVTYECPQDKEKVDAMLKSLGEEEVRSILAEQGKIAIHNEICNFHLVYDEDAVNELFANDDQTLQ
jgi:molecular chaperone Hsp33